MSSWQVSPILVPLIDEVRRKHPGMVIGTIGDAAHQNEKSDHNPDVWGFVCAADFMIGPNFTPVDAEYLFQRPLSLRDDRTAYVIYNRRIYSRTNNAWTVHPYLGSDPHTNHVHVSVIHGSNPRPTNSWNIYPEEDFTMTRTDMETLADLIGTAVVNKLITQDLGKPGGGDTIGVAFQTGILGNGQRILESLDSIETAIHALTPPPSA